MIWPQALVMTSVSTCSTPPFPIVSMPRRTSRNAVWLALVTKRLPLMRTVTRPNADLLQSPITRFDQMETVPPDTSTDPCPPLDCPTAIDEACIVPLLAVSDPIPETPMTALPLVTTSCPPFNQTVPRPPLVPRVRFEEMPRLPPTIVKVPAPPKLPTETKPARTVPFDSVNWPVPVLAMYTTFVGPLLVIVNCPPVTQTAPEPPLVPMVRLEE